MTAHQTMRCGRARRLLWPDAGLRPATPEIVEARAHVAGCTTCSGFFAEMTRLATATHAAARRTVAPIGVRDRLFHALARERAGGGWRPPFALAGLAAATIVALIIAGSAYVAGRRDRTEAARIVNALVEEHATAMSGERLTSADRDAVTRWLEPRVPFAVDVPALTDARLRGARLTIIGEQRAAVVEYESAGRLISYYVVPVGKNGAAVDSSVHTVRRVAAGYQAVLWTAAGVLHAFVGNAPVSQLEQFVRECMEQAQMHAALLQRAGKRLAARSMEVGVGSPTGEV